MPREIAPETTGHGDIPHLEGKYKCIVQFRDAVKGLLIDYNLREDCFSRLSKKPTQSPLEKIFHLQGAKKGGATNNSTPLTKASLRRKMSPTGRNRGQNQK